MIEYTWKFRCDVCGEYYEAKESLCTMAYYPEWEMIKPSYPLEWKMVKSNGIITHCCSHKCLLTLLGLDK